MKEIVTLAFPLIALVGTAQKKMINPLKVGDKVPPGVELSNMINYPGGKAKLSDFKGRLIILDFWNKHCIACIKAFPKMEKLQEQFEGKLQILLVTGNKQSEVKSLFEKSPIVKSTKLPFVFGNTELYKLFPHGPEPFHAWIDGNGIVRATTDGYNATPEHIRDMLDGKPTSLESPDQIDALYSLWDRDALYRSMLEKGNGLLFKYVRYSSVLTGRLPINHNSHGIILDSLSKKKIGVRFINMPALSLYVSAFKVPEERIIFEVDNAEDFRYPKDPNKIGEWSRKNLYCYELKVPPEQTRLIDRIFQEDLERFLRIKAIKEKRLIKCMVLVRTTNEDKLAAKNPRKPGGEFLAEMTTKSLVLQSAPLQSLLIRIKEALNIETPMFEETGYKGDVDVEIKSEAFNSIESLKKALAIYALDLIEEEREMDVLVLRKKE